MRSATPSTSRLHHPWWSLVLVAAGAWVLRIAGFFHRGGALGHPVDYDEGVYFSAAALLSHGLLPYRDYFFVHPPGIAVLLAPVAALARGFDAALTFTVVRWLVPGFGALSALLSGRIAQEQWGVRAGVVAALAYAVFPEAAATERGPFLEALLNLTCLAMAWVSLRPGSDVSSWRRDLLAGALLATACAIKLTAGAWVIAMVWALSLAGQGRRALRVVLVAAVVGLLWLGPFFALAPAAMFDGLLRFQLLRPPDGEPDVWQRLLMILGEGRTGLSALCLWGLVVALARTCRREAVAERLFSAAWLLTVATFLSSKSYWTQYNAHLAPTMAVLAGLGASVLLRWADTRSRKQAALVTATVMLIALSPLPAAIRSANQRDRFLLTLGHTLRVAVPGDSALCTFEPAWAIAAGRLPGIPRGAPVLVDPYGLMLNDALGTPGRFANAGAAFEDERSQRTMLPLLSRCDYLVLEGRGEWQLSSASERWVQEHFVREGTFWRRATK
ncbi:glycosyltransferase family 39 protein [Myxococcus sp. AM011]|uniref:glycosyltransferase family 39 protein n=1 Tax=Myxococcus sp. AM011 TaxID=2745200 RepID=UPI00159626CD|nr:glycosyltransferase family 39 protein [Myxococcus sp. AM011]